MTHLIEAHPAAFAILGYWLFSAVIGGMPEPDAKAGPAYRWAFNSLHLLAGNLAAAAAARYGTLAVPAGSSVEHKETTTVVTPPSTLGKEDASP